ncbi:hypothetical protein LV779_33170 [Streptomyces thinghirensis]|nr:hypothetical protein [Streptomyces thinghirensis]
MSEPRSAPTVGQVVLGRRLLDLRERAGPPSARKPPASCASPPRSAAWRWPRSPSRSRISSSC